MDPLGIITAVIGLVLMLSITVFVFSFTHKWRNIFKIYWGFVVFLCSHLLLFSLAVFGGPDTLPALLNEYTIGILNFGDILIGF